jgi:hypothetical protein
MSRRTRPDAPAAPLAVSPAPWLLLIHQLPPTPAFLRVMVWRRLQGLGAVSVKNSVYVLPTSDQTREDFQWLLREIERGGGEGMICEANLVDGLSDQEVRGLFDAARDVDYAEVTKALRDIAARLNRRGARNQDAELKPQIVKLRRRLGEISEIDFFSATGRLTAEGLLSEIEARVADAPPPKQEAELVKTPPSDLKGKTWVTRQDVHIDRIACAWLIRRFIDPDAKFKFVSAKNYEAMPGELRFDMFKAEFTHEGDSCTFEVMLDRIGLKEAALRPLAEIVHDIDLKDAKFGREQAAGIAHVIAGVCMTQPDDMARIERSSPLFDDTYEYFKRKRGR